MPVWTVVCPSAPEGIVKDHVYMKRSVQQKMVYMLSHIQHCIIEYDAIDHTHWTYTCLSLTDVRVVQNRCDT